MVPEQKARTQTNQSELVRAAPPLMIPLDRNSSIPIFRQIYSAIRRDILSARLPSGSRLPPTRALADDLKVARMTVVLAYEHLEAEGYVDGHGSAGTFVAHLSLPRQTRQSAPLMDNGDTVESELRPAAVPFRLGEPALDAFPMGLWARLHARCARRFGTKLLGYGGPNGYLPLRRAIAEYVAISRSVVATANQVILVRGAQQAMDLVARVLLQPEDQVWIEDPGYGAVRSLIELCGAKAVPVPVDKEGLIVEHGIRQAPKARMACVAPSHHFPLGRTLSLTRRLALLEWARKTRAWIVEDDYDSEFRYTGSPIASLQGLDTSGRVIYIGTFSKTIFPALRLGYVIAPAEVVDQFREVQTTIEYLSPTVEQATLTEFIEGGHFTRHVRRMRAIYQERQQALLTAAERELDGLLQIEPADTGMHVVGWLSRRGITDSKVSDEAEKRGLEVRALSRYCMRVKLPPGVVLGFAALRPRVLLSGVRTLRSILTELYS